MRLRKRSSKIATLLAITTTVLAGSTAVASAVPATFTPASGTFSWYMTTPLVITWPTSPTTSVTYTCPGLPSTQNNIWQTAAFSNSGSPLQGSIDSLYGFAPLTCTSGSGGGVKIWVRSGAALKADRNGSAFSLTSSNLLVQIVGGPVASGGVQYTVPWTNPTGAPGFPGMPGITFNSTPVAQTVVGPVRFTGTIKAATSAALS